MAGARRARILEVAAPLFARHGYHGVSIDELGAAAGVSGPALYRHFASKEEILAELLLDVSRRLLATGRARVAANPSPGDALAALVAAQVDFALSEPALITLQARDLDAVPGTARRQVRRLQRQYVELWVEAIAGAAGVPAEVARAGAHAAFGLINSTPHSARLPADEMAALLEASAAAALGALAPAGAARLGSTLATAG